MYVKSVSFVTCFAERYFGNSPMVVKRIDAKFRIILTQCKKWYISTYRISIPLVMYIFYIFDL